MYYPYAISIAYLYANTCYPNNPFLFITLCLNLLSYPYYQSFFCYLYGLLPIVRPDGLFSF